MPVPSLYTAYALEGKAVAEPGLSVAPVEVLAAPESAHKLG